MTRFPESGGGCSIKGIPDRPHEEEADNPEGDHRGDERGDMNAERIDDHDASETED